MKNLPGVSTNPLELDCAAETERICSWLRKTMIKRIKRRGLIVSISGGIDSAVTAALCAKALGENNVFGLLLPEKESDRETIDLSRKVVESIGIRYLHIDITSILTEFGAYKKRDSAIKQLIPEYSKEWKSKIIINNIVEKEALHYFSIVVLSPEGKKIKKRLDKDSYLELVAATNFKQRVRKILEYYHADRLNYAVAGTPNKLEYDQGFFVKLGDGAADIKPIAHLYKSQVYHLAEYLKIPEDIRKRPPTTDTYSLSQSQEEFFFSLPYEKMDLCHYGKINDVEATEIAKLVGFERKNVEDIYKIIEKKMKAANYLHSSSLLV